MAHPDDEVIFGWPVLHQTEKIIILSTDRFNPKRPFCVERQTALEDVCAELKIPYESYPNDSEFYRLPTRDESLKQMFPDINIGWGGQVFTHNPWGEYGHIDHILVNQVYGRGAHCSDILIDSNWLPIHRHGLGRKICTAKWDEALYRKLEEIYRAYNVWTWNRPPVKEASIYEIHHSYK